MRPNQKQTKVNNVNSIWQPWVYCENQVELMMWWRKTRAIYPSWASSQLLNESMDWIRQLSATWSLYSIQSATTSRLSDEDCDDVLSVQLRVILGPRRCTETEQVRCVGSLNVSAGEATREVNTDAVDEPWCPQTHVVTAAIFNYIWQQRWRWWQLTALAPLSPLSLSTIHLAPF